MTPLTVTLVTLPVVVEPWMESIVAEFSTERPSQNIGPKSFTNRSCHWRSILKPTM